MNEIMIHTPSKPYPVFVGAGATRQLEAFLQEHFPSRTKTLIITDETIANLHLDQLKGLLSSCQTIDYIVPAGEKAKTFEVYYQILSFALEQKLDRNSLILSFGGGAVGDVSGFVAATFMRGIPLIQIPTTILAHDSAVGGKVAINHPLGKNMIGAFYQPEAVFYDLDLLRTLPLKEWRSGFGEVIKHALISDRMFYQWLLQITSLNTLSLESLSFALTKGIQIKGDYVSADERESGARAFLNFGHTLGHAIEAEAGYGEITHGEGVVMGLLFALGISQEVLGLSFNREEFRNWLTKLGYEVSIPSAISCKKLLERMKGDKKAINQKVRFVLLESIGKPKLVELDDDYLYNALLNFQ